MKWQIDISAHGQLLAKILEFEHLVAFFYASPQAQYEHFLERPNMSIFLREADGQTPYFGAKCDNNPPLLLLWGKLKKQNKTAK